MEQPVEYSRGLLEAGLKKKEKARLTQCFYVIPIIFEKAYHHWANICQFSRCTHRADIGKSTVSRIMLHLIFKDHSNHFQHGWAEHFWSVNQCTLGQLNTELILLLGALWRQCSSSKESKQTWLPTCLQNIEMCVRRRPNSGTTGKKERLPHSHRDDHQHKCWASRPKARQRYCVLGRHISQTFENCAWRPKMFRHTRDNAYQGCLPCKINVTNNVTGVFHPFALSLKLLLN